ncbi:MAG TPA: LuxR C-terminal-related transcriptional regulator [Acidimicrobiales bacterium]|nr:LuxR C-terminal-related transcriptional regulator [Acidimicrobiales bacterium]
MATLATPLALEGLRYEAVRVVHSLVPATSTTWNEISSDGNIDVVGVPEVEPWPGGESAFARLIVDHPVIAQIRRTNDGRPRAISDLWSEDEFHRSALYREFYSHLGAEDQLSFTVPSPHILIGVALNRSKRGFSARDRTVANLMRPHLLQAYRNAIANEQIGYLLEVVNDLSNERKEGVLLLNRKGTPEHWTPAAVNLLSHWFPAGASGQLPEQLVEWLKQDEGSRPMVPTWPLVFERGARRLVVRRLKSVHDARQDDVLLVSERLVGADPPDLTRLGLSSRQGEVLGLVARGLANAQIAVQLEISVRTVEGHLRQVYGLLGVNSRTAAVSLVHQMELADQGTRGSAV